MRFGIFEMVDGNCCEMSEYVFHFNLMIISSLKKHICDIYQYYVMILFE